MKSPREKAPALRRVSIVLLPLLLTSCQTTVSGGIKSSGACVTFKPILWSKQDTLETAKQVIEHNAAWRAVCGAI